MSSWRVVWFAYACQDETYGGACVVTASVSRTGITGCKGANARITSGVIPAIAAVGVGRRRAAVEGWEEAVDGVA